MEDDMLHIVILAGQKWRGTIYYEEAHFRVSDDYARMLIADGIAREATDEERDAHKTR